MTALAKKIQELRKQRGQFKSQFAKATNLAHTTISRIENGKPMRLSTVRDLRSCLKLSDKDYTALAVAWIETELAVNAPELVKKILVTPAGKNEIADAFMQVDPIFRDALLKAMGEPIIMASMKALVDVWNKPK